MSQLLLPARRKLQEERRRKLKVLVSSCVLGNPVRWNNSSRKYDFLVEWAEENDIELVPACPETELLGAPRRPIRMIQIGSLVKAFAGEEEVYESLERVCSKIIKENPEVCGFIGLANSPTCGMSAGVKKRGSTIRGAMHRVVEVPSCEVNQLKDEKMRKSFLNKILMYASNKIMNE